VTKAERSSRAEHREPHSAHSGVPSWSSGATVSKASCNSLQSTVNTAFGSAPTTHHPPQRAALRKRSVRELFILSLIRISCCCGPRLSVCGRVEVGGVFRRCLRGRQRQTLSGNHASPQFSPNRIRRVKVPFLLSSYEIELVAAAVYSEADSQRQPSYLIQ